MLDLRSWTFARIALVSTLWIVLNLALAAALIYVQFRRLSSAGSGGIGAVSIGIVVLLIPVIYLVGPPAVLAFMWYFARRASR